MAAVRRGMSWYSKPTLLGKISASAKSSLAVNLPIPVVTLISALEILAAGSLPAASAISCAGVVSKFKPSCGGGAMYGLPGRIIR